MVRHPVRPRGKLAFPQATRFPGQDYKNRLRSILGFVMVVQ
jgi:hypothetical protein